MNKFSKIILILVVVVFIIIFVYLISSCNVEKKQERNTSKFPYEQGVFPSKEEREKANIGVVYLKNMKEISKVWETNEPITKVAVNIEYTINNIFNPAINSINDLGNFFQGHRKEISEKLYINDYTDFERIIMKINNNNNSAIVEASILKNSTENRNGKIYAKIELKLMNNKKSVLNLEINEKTSQVYIKE